jgi:hypothetical protein
MKILTREQFRSYFILRDGRFLQLHDFPRRKNMEFARPLETSGGCETDCIRENSLDLLHAKGGEIRVQQIVRAIPMCNKSLIPDRTTR